MRGHVAFCGLILIIFFRFSEQLGTTPVSKGTDCSDVKSKDSNASSGDYWVKPHGFKDPFKVYCEMRSDGAWTVFQRRSGPEVKFTRKWVKYRNGFGSVSHDHWLGLQKTWALIKDGGWTLRVDLWDHENNTAYAEYSDFRLGDESTQFKLELHTYQGTAGDAFRGTWPEQNQTGFGFSTVDRDNDGCDPCQYGDVLQNRCTDIKGGGWWYSTCGSAALHGDYHPEGDHIGWASGLVWRTWTGRIPYSLKATRMMVKPGNVIQNQV